MDNRIKYFLTTAECLNFTEAARMHYISQQALSDHIKRLELEYKVILFNRRPKVSLTVEGEKFYKAAKKLKIINDNLVKELDEMSSGSRGSFNFGINSSRARVIIPRVIKIFTKKFPNVNVQIHLKDTIEMEKMLKNGSLDLFLGVNVNIDDDFSITELTKDKIYLICSEETQNKFIEQGILINKKIDLNNLIDSNFILNLSKSTTTDEIKRMLSNLKIRVKNPLSISDYQTQIEICRYSNSLSFVPEFLINYIRETNKMFDPANKIVFYSINESYNPLSVQIVKSNYIDYPLYVKEFINILSDCIINLKQKKDS